MRTPDCRTKSETPEAAHAIARERLHLRSPCCMPKAESLAKDDLGGRAGSCSCRGLAAPHGVLPIRCKPYPRANDDPNGGRYRRASSGQGASTG